MGGELAKSWRCCVSIDIHDRWGGGELAWDERGVGGLGSCRELVRDDGVRDNNALCVERVGVFRRFRLGVDVEA